MSSLRARHSANASGCAFRIDSSPCGPSNDLPSGSVPDALIGNCPSFVRQAPMASKFSSPNPNGSMRVWQEAQIAFLRCSSNCSRIEDDKPILASSRFGTSGGGGGGGAPTRFSSTHFPRSTGDVRLAYEEIVSTLALPSRPLPCASAANDTLRNSAPCTLGTL